MAKNSKMAICRNCGSPLAAGTKICSACGAKNSKPFYKRVWFVLLAVIVVLGIIGGIGGCESKRESPRSADVSESTPLPEAYTAPVPASEELPSSEKEPPAEEEPEAKAPAEDPAPEEDADDTGGLVDGMRPEFKEAMDSYEAFYEDYCDFMQSYADNPTDLMLLAEYTSLLGKAADMDEKFEAWDEDEMNSAELDYYIDVHARILKMLADVAA